MPKILYALLLALTTILASGAVEARTLVLTYSGNPFSEYLNGVPTGATRPVFSGSIELDTKIIGDYINNGFSFNSNWRTTTYDIRAAGITKWTFSISILPIVSAGVYFRFDDLGQVTRWSIYHDADPEYYSSTQNGDLKEAHFVSPYTYEAVPGTWSVKVLGTVPAPMPALLLGAGLGGLSLTQLMRKRRAT